MVSKKQKSRSAFSYLRLLVTVNPKPLDFILLFFGVSASIGAGVPFPIMALLFGQLVDQLNGASCSNSNEQDSASDMHSNAAISSKVLLTVYVAIANFILIYVATGSWTMFGERLVRRLRYAYLRSLLQQEVAFFETCPAGEVARRLDGDLTTIQSGVSEKVGIVIQSLSYFCTAYIVSFTLDAPLTGMLVSLIPAYLLMTYLGGRLSTKYRGQVEKRLAPAIAVASESMANMKLIKAFHAGGKVQSMFNRHLATTHRPALGKLVVAAVQMGLLYFIAYSANALAISQGGRQIADSISSGSGITLGAVYTVMMTLVDASYIISQVAPFATIFAAASEASTQILNTINRTPEIDSSRNGQGHVMAKVQGRVEFHDVVFSYPSRPDIKVHDKLSLTIPAGKMTGIVGGSGCGKSTIATLTQRFYDPAQGKILVDGLDVRDIQLRSLRGQIGYVEQNPVLFDRSILENIAHGLIGSSQPEHAALHELLVGGHLSILVKRVLQGGKLEELASHHSQLQRIVSLIKLAATQAGLDDFLAKSPHGLAAPVGTGGGELSGGQKQRVALARTLVRDPAIIILDEATAALDSTTEAQIMESIHDLPGKRTIICVAHRLSTVKNADNILVMGPGGSIIEEGGYTELINLGSVFASMVQSQAIVLEEENTRQAYEEKVDTSSSRPQDPEKHGASDELSSENTPTSTTTESTTKPIAKVNNLSIFLRLLRLDRARHRVLSLVGLFASVVVGGAHAGEAVIFGNAVGNLASCRSSHAVRSSASLYGLLFFLLALVEFLANTVSASCFGYVSDRLVNNFRQFTLEALLRRDLEWHEAGDRTPGSLISYFTADATNMSGLTGVILGVTVSVSVTLIGGIILANVVAWKISLVLTACVPLIFVSGFLRLRLQARFAARHAKAFSSSVSTASEGVTQIKTVAAFSLQDEVLNTFQRSLDEPYKATLKSIAYGNLWLAGAFSVGSFVKALAFWWGGRLIARGEITQVDFFISLVSLLSAAQTSGQLFSLSPDITKAVVAARRVFGLICPDGRIHHLQLGKPSEDDTEKRSSISHGKGAYSDVGVAVSLDNVTFSYSSSPSAPVLRNLSMEIPAGSFIALVGTSGAGKSTIMSLIGALYKPTSGRVMLDGYDIGRRRGKAINEDADTRHEEDEHDPSLPVWDDMALVPQDPTLFSGSVAFNIELGSRQGHVASSAEVEHAARLANIHDMVKGLPDGYETLCGPMGSQVFSGGQKQRLCIARALLRKPRLLLLDEPSSAMDTESERLFEETLENLMHLNDQGQRRVTVVTIAHRLRTVIKADKIFVIEHGEILDAGTHTELVGRCAKYREDVVHQTLS